MASPEYLCSPWTLALGADPVGSTPRFDRLVLAEVPLPWPRDVSEMPGLAPIADRDPLTRVQAVVPSSERHPAVLVTVWERSGEGLVGREGVVDPGELTSVLDRVGAGDVPAGFEPAPPELLVCGHGARDRCCGNQGTRLFTEASARGWALRVRRTSHLGGHRFAPTALTLPDGRLWAFLDPEVLGGIVERTAAPSDLRRSYRGTSALDPWAQVAERELFERFGWGWIDTSITRCDVEVAGDRATIELRWPGGTARAVVERAGTYPIIDCGRPPEAAEKTSDEYRLVAIEVA